MSKKVFIKTYGCAANQSDSEVMAGILERDGYLLVKDEKEADVIVTNTCSVKNVTQEKIITYLNKIPKTKKLIVGGCLTKTIDIRKRVAKVDAILDTNSITKISDAIKYSKDFFSDIKEECIIVPRIRTKKDTAIISVGQGCQNICSFCATKLARGNLVSYRIGDIKRAVQESVKEGCNKIYLTGQDTGCYGFDIKTNLSELLNEITQIPGNYKIRVGMMNPWHTIRILDKLIESYKNEKIMKFLHIPVQSGSEEVLKHMKRVHTVENFKTIVKRFRREFPDITISTDIIVGYPTETDSDFQATYKLIEKIKPEVINISKFASRPKTSASKLKQLDSKIIKKRSVELTKLYINYKKYKLNGFWI